MRSFVSIATLALLVGCLNRGQVAPPAASTGGEAVATYYAPEGSTPVSQMRGTLQPRYPDSLRRARVEGSVVAQYVIDTSGTPLVGSFRVVSTTDTLFAAAVRGAMSGFRFVPASLHGRKVRQLVQQAIYFDMVDGVAKGARGPSPRPVPVADANNRNPMPLMPLIVTAVAR